MTFFEIHFSGQHLSILRIPYEDNVASISFSKIIKSMFYVFGSTQAMRRPAYGVLADCQNKQTRNKLRQAATSATSILS